MLLSPRPAVDTKFPCPVAVIGDDGLKQGKKIARQPVLKLDNPFLNSIAAKAGFYRV
jgi:hypothetical protein